MALLSKLKSNPSLPGLLLLVTAWLLFFARLLSGKYIYFLDDLKILYYPLEIAYSQFQNAWQLPLWSPLFGFGQPLLAWGQLGFFTPLHILLRALQVDPLNLLQISVVAYFALGLVGFYILLRQYQLTSLIAATGAIIYTFSGFNIGHLNHVNFYVGTMVLPWLLVVVTLFIRRPTLAYAATMAALVGIITLSAQPQIALYSFCSAAIYGLVLTLTTLRSRTIRHLTKIVLYTAVSGCIAFLISSLAILPLAEFLPETERSADLPVEELLDFSYPPSHAITLIAPYFFGDHSLYWGAKGFQELAAFTGILPLLLAGLAVTRWHNYRELRLTGMLFVGIGIVMALGRHSPLYAYLVNNHILTTLNIPGRFVFFFTTGIALLTPIALYDLATHHISTSRRFMSASIPLLLLAALLTPFAVRLSEPTLAHQAAELARQLDSSLILALIGLVTYCAIVFFPQATRLFRAPIIILCIVSSATLLLLGYNYSPVTTRTSFNNSLPFATPLANHSQNTGLPARLYSRDVLLNNIPSHKVVATEPLGPAYTIFQPVTITNPHHPCFIIPMQAATNAGTVEVSLLLSLHAAPLDTAAIPAHRTLLQSEQKVCFSATLPQTPFEGVLRFSSQEQTTVRLAIYPFESLSAYLVRTDNLSPEIIDASQKPHRIDLVQDLSSQYDNETLLLARHLQVAGEASSARWIGALSIKPYRDFIDQFLANDLDKPFTGDGEHIIQANRTLFNMVGVTHLAQNLPPESQDMMMENGYRTIAETKTGRRTYRLYENPAAYPKAWLAQTAVFTPSADEARHALNDPLFNPSKTVYISGPKPPSAAELATKALQPGDSEQSVHIASYQPTTVTLQVKTPRDTWLILSDSTLPQWQTYIDNQPAPYYVANTFMKAAFVPAGDHTVSFIYNSPATNRAMKMTYGGLLLLLLCYTPALALRLYRGSSKSHVGVPPHTS